MSFGDEDNWTLHLFSHEQLLVCCVSMRNSPNDWRHIKYNLLVEFKFCRLSPHLAGIIFEKPWIYLPPIYEFHKRKDLTFPLWWKTELKLFRSGQCLRVRGTYKKRDMSSLQTCSNSTVRLYEGSWRPYEDLLSVAINIKI